MHALIGQLIEKINDFNLVLDATYKLMSEEPEKGSGRSVNWKEVVKRYEANRDGSERGKAANS